MRVGCTFALTSPASVRPASSAAAAATPVKSAVESAAAATSVRSVILYLVLIITRRFLSSRLTRALVAAFSLFLR